MSPPLSDAIQELYDFYSRKPKMHTPTDVYRAIVFDLNELADGGAWTYTYIYNMHNGKQLDSVGAMMKWAIGELHRQEIKPKRSGNEYTRKRNATLNEYAIRKGYKSWSEVATIAYNGGDPLKEK